MLERPRQQSHRIWAGQAASFQKRCGKFLRHAKGASACTVDDRPGGFRLGAQPAFIIDEFDEAIEPGAFGCVSHPSPAQHAFIGQDGADVINLVPDRDPQIGGDIGGIAAGHPVRGCDVLQPAHIDGVVDVAQFVNVTGIRVKRISKTVRSGGGGIGPLHLGQHKGIGFGFFG